MMKRLSIFWNKSFTDWRYRSLLHTGFWLFLLFFWMQESVVLKINWQQHYSVTLLGVILSLFLYYPLVYVIVPQLQKRNWVIAIGLFVPYYILAVLLRDYHIQQIINWYNLKQTWIVGNDFFKELYKNHLNPLALLRTFFSSISSLVEIIYIPLTIKFIRYAYQFSLRQAWLARENTQLQLNTLKAQINPHFFFNTLNNLQSFIVQNEKEKSVELLNQLADFMRTSLYDCESEFIAMRNELALLTNYIAIERVRFEEQADITVNLLNQDPYYMIPPFIFLPFVENAFKHGACGLPEDIRIRISLVNTPERLQLKISNTYRIEVAKGGIGLINVRKRLEHYFPGKYLLNIEKTDHFYSLILEIQKL